MDGECCDCPGKAFCALCVAAMYRFALYTLFAMAPMCAHAEQGWACTQNGVVQKYEFNFNRQSLIAERTTEYEIVTNNDGGIVAIDATVVETDRPPSVFASVILIEKTTGTFREIVNFAKGPNYVINGSCVSY